MVLLQPGTLVLVIVAALGYSVATIGMKMGAHALTGAALAVLAVGFLAAAVSEIVLLKSADLGIVYIAIIGVETLVVLSYAWWIGEGLSLRQLGGAGMVLAGLAVVAH
jgi:small multidrug resistance pump